MIRFLVRTATYLSDRLSTCLRSVSFRWRLGSLGQSLIVLLLAVASERSLAQNAGDSVTTSTPQIAIAESPDGENTGTVSNAGDRLVAASADTECAILPTYAPASLTPPEAAPPLGLIIEMSLAPPANIPSGYYDLAKYGRIGVDYSHAAAFDGFNIGVAAQALHVEHHLLLYAAGLSTDINNDGMFILTAGLSYYQTGNDQTSFVDAPFMRIRFQSSQDDLYIYSEAETTMHFRQYISGMAGLGYRVSRSIQLMGGFHHTEFVMPEQQTVQMINGLEGIVSWGF